MPQKKPKAFIFTSSIIAKKVILLNWKDRTKIYITQWFNILMDTLMLEKMTASHRNKVSIFEKIWSPLLSSWINEIETWTNAYNQGVDKFISSWLVTDQRITIFIVLSFFLYSFYFLFLLVTLCSVCSCICVSYGHVRLLMCMFWLVCIMYTPKSIN